MLKKYVFYIIACVSLALLISCNHSEKSTKTFTLRGTMEGENTDYLIMFYTDSSNVNKRDTIPVKGKTFSKTATLIHPQMVSFYSNLTGRYMEDPNRVSFFLEPEEVELNLKEGEFKEVEIEGLKTQSEYVALNEKTEPIYDEIEQIRIKIEELKDRNITSKNENLETEVDNLKIEWKSLLDDIQRIKLDYAKENPDSYVSGYILSFYSKSLSKDSLKKYFSNLHPKIQKSIYGEAIQSIIDLHIVNTGEMAPDFSKESLNGGKVKLSDFKGKIVLLDFGAAWCVPCKKEIPAIKKMYDKYHANGFEIIGVSFDKDKDSWKENVAEEKLDWYHVYEGLENLGRENSINKLYTVQPIPAYILIDENGLIIDRYSGAAKDDKGLAELEATLEDIFSSNKKV